MHRRLARGGRQALPRAGRHHPGPGRSLSDAAGRLGAVGLPAPLAELTARRWDAVVVGGGHNGLTAAAYLARAGRSVLVLERRERLGGACSLERPFTDSRYVVSPCAYVVGLLHPLVIEELELARHGYRAQVADPISWCPFPDGDSLTEWRDRRRTLADVERLSPPDVEGYLAYQQLYERIRARLRSAGRDTWIGPAPDRSTIAELLDDGTEALEVLFDLSVAELIERYVGDERLHTALHGGGIIGTYAGPRDAGTASVRLMHNMGLIGGWGYVEGGMGRVSLAIAAAAAEAGAVMATGVAVGAIRPGEGVVLESGELVRADVVLSNADPKATLALCQDRDQVPDAYRARVDAWSVESAVVKVNCGLARLPTFSAAAPGESHVHRAMVVISTGMDATQSAFAACRLGEPAPDWCELYFQTAYDRSVAPPGRHTMSVFAQYAPYRLATGSWESRREEIGGRVLESVTTFAPDVQDCVEHIQVLGPPDIEARTGLTGGHIFQGSCLPDQMWDRRFASRTPVPSLYLCGAATHPGGSVIAVNGRNAAVAVIEDGPSPAG